jgi:hypothetical protein
VEARGRDQARSSRRQAAALLEASHCSSSKSDFETYLPLWHGVILIRRVGISKRQDKYHPTTLPGASNERSPEREEMSMMCKEGSEVLLVFCFYRNAPSTAWRRRCSDYFVDVVTYDCGRRATFTFLLLVLLVCKGCIFALHTSSSSSSLLRTSGSSQRNSICAISRLRRIANVLYLMDSNLRLAGVFEEELGVVFLFFSFFFF